VAAPTLPSKYLHNVAHITDCQLLIPTLAVIGAESVQSLVAVGQTCKQLHALIFVCTKPPLLLTC
jgi:hypothetical protein